MTQTIERAGVQGRWLKRHQAIGWCNLTEKEFSKYIEPNVHIHLGRTFDKRELDIIMERVNPLEL